MESIRLASGCPLAPGGGLPSAQAAGPLAGNRREVHLWRATLDRERSDVRSFENLLSADERARGARSRVSPGRDRFIVARALLRMMLGRYLDCHPGTIRFRYGPNGKPSCAVESAGDDLRFSLSHSSGMALYAFAWGRGVGVDLERIDPRPVDARIAEQYFSPLEQETLRALPPGERPAAFFRCWTRREAYLKARGEGLSRLETWSKIPIVPGALRGLAHPDADAREAPWWFLEEPNLGPGYAGALVVEGRGWRLVDRSWSS